MFKIFKDLWDGIKNLLDWIKNLFQGSVEYSNPGEFSWGGSSGPDLFLITAGASPGPTRVGCRYTFIVGAGDVYFNNTTPASTSWTGELTGDFYVRVTKVSVQFNYQGGIPNVATITAPDGSQNTYECIFPGSWTNEPGTGAEDTWFMKLMSCSDPSDPTLSFLTSAQASYRTDANKWSGCPSLTTPTPTGVEPYLITEFTPLIARASDILFGDWMFEMSRREYTYPIKEGIWVSRCAELGISSGDCDDILQIVFTIELQFYSDGGNHW